MSRIPATLLALTAAARWLVPAAHDWLKVWDERFGVDGFNPFDTLAVAYLTTPELVTCETVQAEIRSLPDDPAEWAGGADVPNKPYLLASVTISTPRIASNTVTRRRMSFPQI